MNINLTEEEVHSLLDILKRELSEMKSEIYHTDNYNFKEDLKKQVLFIQDIINKLNESHIVTVM
jgi:hypothetical protein